MPVMTFGGLNGQGGAQWITVKNSLTDCLVEDDQRQVPRTVVST